MADCFCSEVAGQQVAKGRAAVGEQHKEVGVMLPGKARHTITGPRGIEYVGLVAGKVVALGKRVNGGQNVVGMASGGYYVEQMQSGRRK